MNTGQTVSRQLLQFLPRHEFNLCACRYRGEYRTRSFSAFEQFLCLAYAQLSGHESLRDIETCLNSHREKLYYLGFRGAVSRSTLADANERRDWRIFQDFGQVLIGMAQQLHRDEPLGIELQQPLCLPLTRQPSTCASPCFRGPSSARPRPRSRCTRSLIFTASFQRLWP